MGNKERFQLCGSIHSHAIVKPGLSFNLICFKGSDIQLQGVLIVVMACQWWCRWFVEI